jgi:hypothetical protein
MATTEAARETNLKPVGRHLLVDGLLITLIGLLVQGFWVALIQQPTYMDAYYYTTNGQRLADGHGLTEMIIWQYLDDPAGLPTPSHTYWLPLTSFLAAAGLKITAGYSGARLAFWLLAGLLPLLAYAISRDLSGQRWQGWGAALFTAAAGYYAAFLSQPTTFAPFAWTAGLALWLLGRAGRLDGTRYWFPAGVLVGLAHLTRADGLLLLVAGLVIWIYWAIRLRQRPETERKWRSKALVTLARLVSGYLLVMGGWYIRNWLVIGQPLSAAGTQSLFLTTYDDLFAYGRSFDFNSYLAWGWSNILRSKLDGMWFALQSFVAIPGLIFLAPLIVVGWAVHYRQPASRALLRPVMAYTVLLFLSLSLVFTWPGMRGSLFHSSIALWPWSTALAVAGLAALVDWMAARLPHWRPERAKRMFMALFVVVAFALSLAISLPRTRPDDAPERYAWVGAQVSESAVVMIGNAPALYYYTGLSALSVPNEPADVVLGAARHYGADYLVLDRNHPIPLLDLYQGQSTHPQIQFQGAYQDLRLFKLETAAGGIPAAKLRSALPARERAAGA